MEKPTFLNTLKAISVTNQGIMFKTNSKINVLEGTQETWPFEIRSIWLF